MSGDIDIIFLPHPPPNRVSLNRTAMPSFLKPSAHSPILPLTHRASSPSPGSSSRNTLRSTSRRLSYNLKNRANRHAYPLAVAGLLAALYLYFTWYRTGYHSLTHGRKFHLYTRHQNPFGMKHGATPGTLGRGPGIVNGDRNRVSLLTANEEELIAEDDLYLQSYIEPAPLTPEETAAEQQLQAHREDVLELDRQHQLRALVWWLAEGGTFPRSWDVPTKSHLKKVGGRGMEKILDKVDQVKDGKDDEAMFPDGWADYAKSQYRVVVISKVSRGHNPLFKVGLDLSFSLIVHFQNEPKRFSGTTISLLLHTSSRLTEDVSDCSLLPPCLNLR